MDKEKGFHPIDVQNWPMAQAFTAHHETTEGYHLKVFFEELQRTMDNPCEWLF